MRERSGAFAVVERAGRFSVLGAGAGMALVGAWVMASGLYGGPELSDAEVARAMNLVSALTGAVGAAAGALTARIDRGS